MSELVFWLVYVPGCVVAVAVIIYWMWFRWRYK